MLTLLADTSLAVADAETALDESAFQTATERLDAADAGLAELRAAWPGLAAPQRAVVGPSAAELKTRIGAARARIPKLTALSVGTAESDPEEEQAPSD